jgi:nucleoside-diphosphate-sugar epimerase
MKICILGRHGFIGSALEKRLVSIGHEVESFPTTKTKMLFHFASPVHPPFEMNPDYHTQEILTSFMYLLPFCRDNNIYFVYPSSALIYEKDTQFAKIKTIMEIMASMYPRTLGLRIFPVYGPGEGRTAIAQWCSEMRKGNRPFVYGDGTQERDFIYIDDVVDGILGYAGLTGEFGGFQSGIRDIGAGKPVSFNAIVDTINIILGSDLKPLYRNSPQNYSKGIVCKNPVPTKFSIYDGCKKLLELSV